MDSDVFFGSSDPDLRPAYTLSDIKKARDICRSCPVLEQCLTASLDNREEYGVWAGTTVSQRKQMFKQMDQGQSAMGIVKEYLKHFLSIPPMKLPSMCSTEGAQEKAGLKLPSPYTAGSTKTSA